MYPLNEKERQMRKFPALMMALMSGVVLNLACAPAKTRTVLWNGTNFDGWVRYVPDQTVQVDTVWTSQDGVLRCSGKPTGYIRTRASFSDYHLHLEWRWVKEGGNSGVLLHCQGPDQVWPHCIEAQLKSGDAGDLVLIGPGEITVAGKTYKNDRPFLIIANQKDDIENPVGEWNSYTRSPRAEHHLFGERRRGQPRRKGFCRCGTHRPAERGRRDRVSRYLAGEIAGAINRPPGDDRPAREDESGDDCRRNFIYSPCR